MAIDTPTRTPGPAPEEPRSAGLAARVSLGRLFAPVPSEFYLIASSAVLLTLFGLVMVLSATAAAGEGENPFDALLKQSVFAVLGLPLMFIASRFPVGFWKKIAWPLLGVTVVLQLLVFVPGLGLEIQGNRNWILVAGQTIQPSEFLKLSLAIWIGYVLFRKRTLLGLWRHVFIPLVPVSAAVLATVMAGDDLGTTMILVLVVFGALFFSGVKLRIFILPLAIAAIGVYYYLVSSENRMRRVFSFLDPNCDAYNECYQSQHGVFGLSWGGVFGLGLGNSKEKYGWLPARENDYIFAIVGEELGLIGCIVLLGLFTIFTVGAFHVIRKTDDPFVRIVAGGITAWIVGQALINIGVVLRVFPVLGVPLPFMSQGGTALLAVLAASGVLLSLARSLPRRAPSLP